MKDKWLRQASKRFLACRPLAVAGVTRNRPNESANLIYRTLRAQGKQVFAINPHAERVEGDPCYPDLEHLPEKPEGVVLITKPEVTARLMESCVKLRIPRVWMHRAFGEGSVSDEAVALGRKNGIEVIPGACPMMYFEHPDFGHRCMRAILRFTGKLPKDPD